MSIIDKIEEAIAPLLESEHIELVDTQYVNEHGKKVLRLFLDKEGGFNLSDCEVMSRKIGDFLDTTDILPDGYILEVSSPGLDRVLKKEKDFVRFTGRRIRVTVFAPIEGQRNFLGPIRKVEAGCVVIDDITGKQLTIPIDKIARARLEPDI